MPYTALHSSSLNLIGCMICNPLQFHLLRSQMRLWLASWIGCGASSTWDLSLSWPPPASLQMTSPIAASPGYCCPLVVHWKVSGSRLKGLYYVVAIMANERDWICKHPRTWDIWIILSQSTNLFPFYIHSRAIFIDKCSVKTEQKNSQEFTFERHDMLCSCA